MRRLLPACLVALALAVSVAPVHAQSTILDRKPMDVGADQVGAIRQLSQDMLYPYRYPKLWFDVGVAYPVGNLQDRNIDPGLMLRFNQTFWHSDALSAYGSVGAMFGNDSYFNDAQNAIAAAAPISTDPQQHVQRRRHPVALLLDGAGDGERPVRAQVRRRHRPVDRGRPRRRVDARVVHHERGEQRRRQPDLGPGGETDPLVTGPGGEQEISPYAIRSSSKFNLGWDARGGLGFRVGKGDRPMWARLMFGGTTYYTHTAPSTNMAFAVSFGR